MNRIPKVIDVVVKNDLCIGCGLCAYKCPSNAIGMEWDEFGFLVPTLSEKCDSNEDCIKVCPFNPFPEKEVKTENELADNFLPKNISSHRRIGKFKEIYAGYSKEFRLTSSSGGMATYIFNELLEKKFIDYAISVKKSNKKSKFYDFSISSSKDELLAASKTRYFPVTLNEAFDKLRELNGKVAISGIACFIKAIRLAQYQEPELKKKIVFLVGIICGGVKSRFYTEYLANMAGANDDNYKNPQYRVKNIHARANDYSFSCQHGNQNKMVAMKSVGDMWGTGMFKANACDFCDDVTTELADISLGDAWLEPYINDGRGNNVVIVRSELAKILVKDGLKNDKLILDTLSPERMIASQRGNFNHRQKAISFRIKMANRQGYLTPPKRYDEKISLPFKIVQLIRKKIRKKSLRKWALNRNADLFNKSMKKNLFLLKAFTTWYHYQRKITNKSEK